MSNWLPPTTKEPGIIHGHALRRSAFIIIERNNDSFLLGGNGPSVSLLLLDTDTGRASLLSELNVFSSLSAEVTHLVCLEGGVKIAAASTHFLAIFEFSKLEAGGCLCAEHVISFTDYIVNIDYDQKSLTAVFSNGRIDDFTYNSDRKIKIVPGTIGRVPLSKARDAIVTVSYCTFFPHGRIMSTVSASGQVVSYQNFKLVHQIECIKQDSEDVIVHSEYFMMELLILCNRGVAYIIHQRPGPDVVERKLHPVKSITSSIGTKYGGVFIGSANGEIVYWNVDTEFRRRVRQQGFDKDISTAEFTNYPTGLSSLTALVLWDKMEKLIIGSSNGFLASISSDFKIPCLMNSYVLHEDYVVQKALFIDFTKISFMELYNGKRRLLGCCLADRLLFILTTPLPMLKVILYLPFNTSKPTRCAAVYTSDALYYYHFLINSTADPNTVFHKNMVKIVTFPTNARIINVIMCGEAAIVETRTDETSTVQRIFLNLEDGHKTSLNIGTSTCVAMDMIHDQPDVVVYCTATHCYIRNIKKPNKSTIILNLEESMEGRPIVAVLSSPNSIVILSKHSVIKLRGNEYNERQRLDICALINITDARDLYWHRDNLYVGAFHKGNYLVIDIAFKIPMLSFPCGTLADSAYQLRLSVRNVNYFALDYCKHQTSCLMRSGQLFLNPLRSGLQTDRIRDIRTLKFTKDSVELCTIGFGGAVSFSSFSFDKGTWRDQGIRHMKGSSIISSLSPWEDNEQVALVISQRGTDAVFIPSSPVIMTNNEYRSLHDVFNKIEGKITFVGLVQRNSLSDPYETHFGLIGWNNGMVSTVLLAITDVFYIFDLHGFSPPSTVVIPSETIHRIIMTKPAKKKTLLFNVITESGLLYSYVTDQPTSVSTVPISKLPHSKHSLVQNDKVTASTDLTLKTKNGVFSLVVVGCYSGLLTMFLINRDVQTKAMSTQEIGNLDQEIIHIELYNGTRTSFRCVVLTKSGELLSFRVTIDEKNLQFSSTLYSRAFSSVGHPSSFCKVHPTREHYAVVGDGCEMMKKQGIVHGHALRRNGFVIIERNHHYYLLSGHGPAVSLFLVDPKSGATRLISELNIFCPLSTTVTYLVSSETGAEHVISFTDYLVNIDYDRKKKKLTAVFSNGRIDDVSYNPTIKDKIVSHTIIRHELSIAGDVVVSVSYCTIYPLGRILSIVTARGQVISYQNNERIHEIEIESLKQSSDEVIVWSEYFLIELLILCNYGVAYVVQLLSPPVIERKLHPVKSVTCAVGKPSGGVFIGSACGEIIHWHLCTASRRQLYQQFEDEPMRLVLENATVPFTHYQTVCGQVTALLVWDKCSGLIIGSISGHVAVVSSNFLIRYTIDPATIYQDYIVHQRMHVNPTGLSFVELNNGIKKLLCCCIANRVLFVLRTHLPIIKVILCQPCQTRINTPPSRYAAAFSKNTCYYYHISNLAAYNNSAIFHEDMVNIVTLSENVTICNIVICDVAAVVETRHDDTKTLERFTILFRDKSRKGLISDTSSCVAVDVIDQPRLGDLMIYCTSTHCYIQNLNHPREAAAMRDLTKNIRGSSIVDLIALPEQIIMMTSNAIIALDGEHFKTVHRRKLCSQICITDARKFYAHNGIYCGAFYKGNYLIIDMEDRIPIFSFPCGTLKERTYQLRFCLNDSKVHILDYQKDQKSFSLMAQRLSISGIHVGFHRDRVREILPFKWTKQAVTVCAISFDGTALFTKFVFDNGTWEYVGMHHWYDAILIPKPIAVRNGKREAIALSVHATIAYYISSTTVDGKITFVAMEDGKIWSHFLSIASNFCLIGWNNGTVSTLLLNTVDALGTTKIQEISPPSNIIIASESINRIMMTANMRNKSLIFNVLTLSGLLYSYVLVRNVKATASANHNLDLKNGQFHLVVIGCYSGVLIMCLLNRDNETKSVKTHTIGNLDQEIIRIELYQGTKTAFRCVALTKSGELVSFKLIINEKNHQLSSILYSRAFSCVGHPSSFCKVHPTREHYAVVGDGCEIVKFY